jgi:quercetin dioxygenase-like cupin family protein
MSRSFTHIIDLAKEVEPPDDGILTRTLYNDDNVKAVIFGFGQGEELSEHTASTPAILHFIQGDAMLTLGNETVEAQPGTWIHIAANLNHSVQTKAPATPAVEPSGVELAGPSPLVIARYGRQVVGNEHWAASPLVSVVEISVELSVRCKQRDGVELAVVQPSSVQGMSSLDRDTGHSWLP